MDASNDAYNSSLTKRSIGFFLNRQRVICSNDEQEPRKDSELPSRYSALDLLSRLPTISFAIICCYLAAYFLFSGFSMMLDDHRIERDYSNEELYEFSTIQKLAKEQPKVDFEEQFDLQLRAARELLKSGKIQQANMNTLFLLRQTTKRPEGWFLLIEIKIKMCNDGELLQCNAAQARLRKLADLLSKSYNEEEYSAFHILKDSLYAAWPESRLPENCKEFSRFGNR